MMNYVEISKETVSLLHKSYASLTNSPLRPTLRVLIELRVSQINDCSYCCSLHLEEAKKLQVSATKLDMLPQWRSSALYSDEEKAALAWAEAVTRLHQGIEEIKQGLFTYFSEREIVDITASISIMNALNRMAISLK
ncbi:MAG: carboxymuconolactone decarboxylase family protein [Candidatus Melainabacteria bacterium]|nr:carboxymuconolactone decarboxylase family protein [Candidatus Melainabacteria bacterium]